MAMTVTEIQTAARELYNATGDSFFSDAQINNWLWQACHIFAKKALLIERTYTTTTVASTQDYAYPTNTIAIKRVTYNGVKIKRITHREDDAMTLQNSASTMSGSSTYYTDFNFTLSLRPIPSSAVTLKIYSFNDAASISNTSTLEIPTLFQFDTVDYILARMFAKDKDMGSMQLHMALWNEHVRDAIAHKARSRRTDSFATVQDEGTLPATVLGES